MPFTDPITFVMLAVLVLLIFFMFRNSRKRQKDAAALREKITVGAEVMTSFGLYGKLLSIDEEENQVLVETTPGVVLRLHRQTVTRVVEPTVAENVTADAADEDSIRDADASATEPEYGQRLGEAEHKPRTTPGTSVDE